MSATGCLVNVVFMEGDKKLHWPLAIGLGAVALIRPLASLSGLLDGLRPASPIVLTVLVSVLWVAVVGLSGTARAVPTLVAAGVTYSVLSIALGGIASSIMLGELQGPLARPIAILPVLMVNAAWGAITGLIALGVQRQRLGTART